jgi:hypothetical protein
VRLRHLVLAGGWFAAGVLGLAPHASPAAEPAKPAAPAISQEASAALLRMGETLRAPQLSFAARTIRVYADKSGDFLHIFHTIKIVAHRPNRLFAEITGDDGSTRILFDGKTAYVYSVTQNKYAKIPVPEGTIEGLLKEAVGRLHVDFPLADFLSSAPNKAFLTGVTAGGVVNTVTIDGAPYLHLYFDQPPGIALELWLAKDDKSLPARLIVTYRNLPGEPNFIAQFSDWNFDVHPAESEFSFQPPAGAVQVALKPAAPPAKAKGGK